MRIVLTILFLTVFVNSEAQIINARPVYRGVAAAGGSFAYDTIQVNMWDSLNNVGKMNTPAPNFWNNWSVNNANSTTQQALSPYFKWRDGTQSTVQCKEVGYEGSNAYSNNTVGYGAASPANSTGFPDSTFWVANYRLVSSTFTISGLNPVATYTLQFLSSRNAATSRPQTFTINGTSVNLDAAFNKSTLVTFTDIAPNGSNEIVMTISQTATYHYINAFRIIEKIAL